MKVPFLISGVLMAKALVAQEIAVVRDARPLCTIAIPRDTSETVKFAAEELQRYVKKISGVEVDIRAIRTSPNTAAIVIGKIDELNWPCEMPEGKVLGDEGLVVKKAGQRILLSAMSDRGVLYAVYSFLEREIGLRWFAPGPDGEVLPASKDITVNVTDRAETPSFQYRYLKVTNRLEGEWGEKVRDWAIKNRLNVNLGEEDEFLLKRGGMLTEMHTHSWGYLVPTKTYFSSHPEWYALIGTKRRDKGRNTKLCTTNPDVVKFMAQKGIEYFREHPQHELFSVTQSDGMGWCECPRCVELDSGEKWSNVKGEVYPVVTDRMVKFCSDIAQIVVKEFPKKYVYFLAYHSTFEPPVKFRPHPNVLIDVVHSRPNYEYFNKPLESADDKHVKFRAGLNEWLSYGNPVVIYDYSPHSTFMQLPFSAARKFAADVRFLKDAGVCGYEGQTVGLIWGVYGLNYYVLARCFWNAHLDIEALLKDYFSRYYGEAAPPMSEFFRVLEEGLVSHEGMSNGIADYLSEEVLRRARKAIDEAKSLASSDLVRRRIEPHEIMLHYGELFYEGLKLQRRFDKTGSVEDLKAAIAAYKSAAKYTAAKASTYALMARSKLNSVLIRGLENTLKKLEKQGG